MKKLILIGRTGCGKTTLIQALTNEKITYKKTQALSFKNQIIDTPGEYIENRSMYKALIISACDCETVALVQSCLDSACIFPPQFSSIFSRKVIGIITKTDLCKDEKSIKVAEKFLKAAGVNIIYKISAINHEGLDELYKIIN